MRNQRKKTEKRGYKMRLQRKSLLIAVGLLFALIVMAGGQQPISGPQWWYNFPSSPLVFQPTNADVSYMDLKNLSGDTMLRFRLGCLSTTADGVVLAKKLEARDLSLKPGSAYFQSAFDYRTDLKQCPENAQRLAVIEAHFLDGGVWTK